jgi:two-component system, cell cycle response regulator CtrA
MQTAREREQELSEQLEIAHERILMLESQIGVRSSSPALFRLTPKEDEMFGVIMRQTVARKDAMMTLIYSGSLGGDVPCDKILDVFIHKIRQKIRRFGMEIETRRGIGWYMSPADKAKVHALMEDETETYAVDGPLV